MRRSSLDNKTTQDDLISIILAPPSRNKEGSEDSAKIGFKKPGVRKSHSVSQKRPRKMPPRQIFTDLQDILSIEAPPATPSPRSKPFEYVLPEPIKTPQKENTYMNSTLINIENRIINYMHTKLNNLVYEVTKELNDIVKNSDPMWATIKQFKIDLIAEVEKEISFDTQPMSIPECTEIDLFKLAFKECSMAKQKQSKQHERYRNDRINNIINYVSELQKNIPNELNKWAVALNEKIDKLVKARALTSQKEKQIQNKINTINNSKIKLEAQNKFIDLELNSIQKRSELFNFSSISLPIETDDKTELLESIKALKMNASNIDFMVNEVQSNKEGYVIMENLLENFVSIYFQNYCDDYNIDYQTSDSFYLPQPISQYISVY